MTRIYAVAESVPVWSRDYITPGKRYKVLSEKGGGFYFLADVDGRRSFALWTGSGHLDGANWTRIEADECNSEALAELIAGDADLLDIPSARITGDKDRENPVEGAQPDIAQVLADASKAVIDSAFDHYTARNGRRMSIEGDDGEKCWIVPFDQIEDLRAALAQWEASK